MLLSAEGQLEREVLSPIEGADYALLSNGSVLHFLTARGVLDLESYVGRRVAVMIRDRPCQAEQVKLPFYRRPRPAEERTT